MISINAARIVVVVLAVIGTSSPILSQIKPSRSVFVDPLDNTLPAGLMASSWFAGEFHFGLGSYEKDQAWQLRLHGIVEPYRFGDDTSATVTTTFQFHHELTASTMNDLGFNPRTARWEEQLNVHVAVRPFTMQFGFFHRCKHDIDNSEPPNDDTSVVYEPIKRTIIVSGPSVSAATPWFNTFAGDLRIESGAEYYLVNEDYRTPSSRDTGSWNNMHASLWIRGESKIVISDGFHLLGSYYISFPFFSSRVGAEPDIVVPHEAHGEIVGAFLGRRGAFEIVLGADHTFDEVAFVTPHPTTVFQAGIRFRSL